MKKIIGYCLCVLFFGYSVHRLKTMEKNGEQQTPPTNSLLIFLDDSEQDTIRGLTKNFLAAFSQSAGPIIASASLIKNIRDSKIPDEEDPYKLKKIASNILYNTQASPEEEKKLKDIFVSCITFDSDAKNKWIFKEINSQLYLLLPKNYLQIKNIDVNKAIEFSPQDPPTPTELIMGLKINHMKTIDPYDIKKITTTSSLVDYFVNTLSNIFVTNSEYLNRNKKLQPLWSIYILGHGMINDSICALSIEQFKSFMNFLEKIQTRLLIYSSCYAAGTNEGLIYKDSSSVSVIAKTYSFAIITTALTDSVTYGKSLDIKLNSSGQLTLDSKINYDAFVQAITTPGVINYSKALKNLVPTDYIGTTPQIKYPGLPWFSILDRQKVVSIGSIMAKTRTKPLNIATFFAEKGKRVAYPDGILLYAQDIPFEIIINTLKNGRFYIPKFVSMIPGPTVHSIKKITSTVNTTGLILSSFYIPKLEPLKIFIIGEVKAPFSENMRRLLTPHNLKEEGVLTNVIVETGRDIYNTYFTYKGKIYQSTGEKPGNPFALANSLDEQTYKNLLNSRSLTKILDQKMTSTDAQKEIINLLTNLPNNTVRYIPKISFTSKDIFSASDFLRALNLYSLSLHPSTSRKILWIGQLWLEDRQETDSTDVILDISPQETRLLYKQKGIAYSWHNHPVEDYIPTYKELFEYFHKHLTLPDPSIQQLLTSEAIDKIRTAQTWTIKTLPLLSDTLRRQAKETFKEALPTADAEKKIFKLLNAIPNKKMLRIPNILISSCSDNRCWQKFIDSLTKYYPGNAHKILWIERLIDEEKRPGYYDVIIDTNSTRTHIFTQKKYPSTSRKLTTLPAGKNAPSSKDLIKDDKPIYEKIMEDKNSFDAVEHEIEALVDR